MRPLAAQAKQRTDGGLGEQEGAVQMPQAPPQGLLHSHPLRAEPFPSSQTPFSPTPIPRPLRTKRRCWHSRAGPGWTRLRPQQEPGGGCPLTWPHPSSKWDPPGGTHLLACLESREPTAHPEKGVRGSRRLPPYLPLLSWFPPPTRSALE